MKIEINSELSLDVHFNSLVGINGWELRIYYASGGRFDNAVENWSISGNEIYFSLTEGSLRITSEKEDEFWGKQLHLSRNKETETILILPDDFPVREKEIIFIRHKW